MRILVTGASGFIGRHLVPSLRESGHEVLTLARGGPSSGTPRPGTIAGPADLAAIRDWPGWPEGLDAVVHLAALNPARGDRAAKDEAALMQANVEATHALARRAVKEGVARFVFASSAIVHTPKGTEPIREDDPPMPRNLYAASKLAAEAAVRNAVEGSATKAVILRPAPVYGAGGRGATAGLVRLALSPLPLPFAGSGGRRSFLSAANCVEAIGLSLRHPDAAGGIFLVSDGEPVSIGEFVATIRRAEGISPRLFRVPAAATARLARALGQQAAHQRLFGSFVLDASRIRDRLGFSPRSTRDCLRALAENGAFRAPGTR